MHSTKFGGFPLDAFQSLTREQLKNVFGGTEDESVDGEGPRHVVSGKCVGHEGCWTYGTPVTPSQCLADTRTYCRGGGICANYTMTC